MNSNNIPTQTTEPVDSLPTSIESPHQKGPLTTTVGRLVERASYLDLFVAGAMTLGMSTAYFTMAPFEHALGKDARGFADAAYFSVVTFTSLGYGDLSPEGFGRVVAALVVLSGLALIALAVGKVASERQHSILLLLHTSDCQRRLNDFTRELANLKDELAKAAHSASAINTNTAAKSLSGRIEVVGNFLVFNANQARLIEFGNESALLALYNQLQKIQQVCLQVHKSEPVDLLVSRRTRSIANRCLGLVTLMLQFHCNAQRKASYLGSLFRLLPAASQRFSNTKSSSLRTRLSKIQKAMQIDAAAFENWSRSARTPIILEETWLHIPPGNPSTWPKDIHKIVADRLFISNRLAQACIDELLKNGRLPK